MNNSIGGFFELELECNKEYYPDYFKFNFARHAISFYFKNLGINTVWIPTYICESIIEALENDSIRIKFYNINDLINPSLPSQSSKEGLLIVNYFGILNFEAIPKDLMKKKNVLIDNSQSFFTDYKIFSNAVFSPRKYFGIPDGAYLKTTNKMLDYNKLTFFKIEEFIKHLILRIEIGPERAFLNYKKYQEQIKKSEVNKMSLFSQRVLSSVNYDKIKLKRQNNFLRLKKNLFNYNKLKIGEVISPLCYPLLIDDGSDLRKELINNKVFVPQYWPEILSSNKVNKYDLLVSENLVCLPIDQRYGIEEMEKISRIIYKWMSS